MRRRYPNLSEKLASALLELFEWRGHGIPFRDAQRMTTKQICAMVDWDHAVYETWGGSTHPTNLTPRLRADHREKTAKRDIPAIAKVKRVAKARGVDLMLVDVTGERADSYGSRPKRKWPSRKMQSRPFPKRGRPC